MLVDLCALFDFFNKVRFSSIGGGHSIVLLLCRNSVQIDRIKRVFSYSFTKIKRKLLVNTGLKHDVFQYKCDITAVKGVNTYMGSSVPLEPPPRIYV